MNAGRAYVQRGTLKAGYELTCNYADNPFQISVLNDDNYRTDSTIIPVRNNRQYSYDQNGNLIYINTTQASKTDTTDRVGERRLLWDEENRLRAINDNGFVSNYWYDAAGERVIKESGYGEGIFVNGTFSGGTTATDKFTAYVSPYLVVSKGYDYTKHIYIGSQRIVSKLVDFANYGSDPRGTGISKAGADTDNAAVDYDKKYTNSLAQIKETYRIFALPYNGTDNNDYMSGTGTPPPPPAETLEKYQYFYHSDHLGSTSLITDLDGNVAQHVEYVPFGEVFIEERNNKWNTSYLFNGKELDEETGLYYYGARYLDPRTSVWISGDPLQEKYPGVSSYAYCANNPIGFRDPTGMGGEPSMQSPIQQAVAHLKDLFTINIDISSPEKKQQSLAVQQSKNQEIQAYTEAIEILNTGMGLIVPFSSAVEVLANAEAGNNDAALAAVPWLIVDIATAGKGNSATKGVKAVAKTQWGWTGTKIWKTLVDKVKGGGTIEKLNGKIPTKSEAKMLLQDAGVDMSKIREDPAHLSPNPHSYPHINYTTPEGTKGTIQIQ
ncbi:hypothetical protein FACS189434_13610 [Bacteroidia bacterium]|nr:hypothetical protein FACS189434_13610 [Bacteroidia bacterium]